MKNATKSNCHAHYNATTNLYQSIYDHNSETAQIAVENNPIPFFENIIWLCCIYHDAGKFSTLWQDYFRARLTNPDHYSGSKEDHTTAGGVLVEEFVSQSLLRELLQMSIYSHHGLQDSLSLEDDTSLYVKRDEKAKKLPIQECRERFYAENDQSQLLLRFQAAKSESVTLKNKIQNTLKSWENPGVYGKRDFYLGMYVRVLMSLLIDADRRNTEDFMSDMVDGGIFNKEKLEKIWEKCQKNLESKIAGFTDQSGINAYRREISDACRQMAEKEHRLYRLTVPTGAGKTLSSLRFALAHVKKFHKKRIIYVAPYNSIVEQNSDEIKKALGMPEIVLEHHCNIVMETDEEQAKYNRLTEDWSSPVIVTTAVQFLNTLFAGKTGNVRRMHSLCESIIILDEVQAFPVKVVELFNLAVNFLTEFLNSTVVLCTATQPLFDAILENRLRPPMQMVPGFEIYRERLRRTNIVECISGVQGGMDIDEAARFIFEKAQKYKKVLFIANTKACARNLFYKLKEICGDSETISHLSTNMCPEHRRDTLKNVRDYLVFNEGEMQICVSTNLIEAGVDISFWCVIRSLAGLDSIIQAAGRCNRHGKEELGQVFIVKMDEKAENISMLREVRVAQSAMQSVLTQYLKHPESLDGRLDSEQAIKMYFEYFFKTYQEQYGNPLNFPLTVRGVPTTMVDLLSDNPVFAGRDHGWMLKQAFKTAGEEFEVISEDGKCPVVIPFHESVHRKLVDLESPYVSLNQKKKILRELQPYTISISQTERGKVGDGIYGVWDKRVMVLDGRFYDPSVGLITNPGPLEDLQF